MPAAAPPYNRAMSPTPRRYALGISYLGAPFLGWQSQPHGQTVQDHVEYALSALAGQRVRTLCAGRTDTGVHAVQQVVHFDTAVARPLNAWVRGTNRYLPQAIAVQWAQNVDAGFHARGSAQRRRYAYVLLQSPVRPSLEAARVGWCIQQLDSAAMQAAADTLTGTHDFSAFRAAQCQAQNPVKTLQRPVVHRLGPYIRIDFAADAFLHHMIRNIVACLIYVGSGKRDLAWMQTVLRARQRSLAAPTASPSGLYFLGPDYASEWQLPKASAHAAWLPGSAHPSPQPE